MAPRGFLANPTAPALNDPLAATLRSRIEAGIMRFHPGWFAAFALSLLVTGTVRADFVTQTLSVPLSRTTQLGVNANPVATLSFNQFDNQNWTYQLTSVTMTFQGRMQNSADIMAISPNTTLDLGLQTTDVSIQVGPNAQTFTAPVAISYNQSFTTPVNSLASLANPAHLTIPVTDNTAFAADASPSSPYTFTSPAELAYFTGNGVDLVPFFASASSTFHSNTGNGGAEVDTYAGGTVTLTYYYEPTVTPPSPSVAVPEPSTIQLLASGCVLLCLTFGACRWGLRGVGIEPAGH